MSFFFPLPPFSSPASPGAQLSEHTQNWSTSDPLMTPTKPPSPLAWGSATGTRLDSVSTCVVLEFFLHTMKADHLIPLPQSSSGCLSHHKSQTPRHILEDLP